jgi:CheY-like chemotaxis protein
MEAIGRLAGGVAHDFNNLLTVIVGYADLLRERPDNDEPARNAIEEIVRAAERASSLTGQLLAFSRRQIVQVQILDVNTLVRETQGMLTRLIGEDVDFALALDSSPCSIKIDSGQFTQVLMNLAVNARDAMPLGGKLTIETQVIDWQGDEIGRSTTRRAGRYVMLAVSDTGCGMDADTQAHIFEPFFTTKEAGKGTGLGLATVYGIVHQHGGWIDVYSEIQNGASFRAYFPWVGQATAIAGAEHRELAPRRSGTILIVEDQLPIRKLAEKVLTKAGHHVLSAPDGRAGLLLAQEYADNIDLLLTDIVMPVMSGPELAAHLSRLRPRMAVLFMSGYTDHALLHRGAIEQGTAFLQKPFRAEMLISKINELLSPDPSAAD